MTARAAAIVMVAALVAAGCAKDAADPPPLVTAPVTSIVDDPAVDDPAVEDSSTTSEPATTGAPPAEIPIEQVTCPAELERDDGLALACGFVIVPVDRADAALGTTTITIATLAGTDPTAGAPVAVLQGGPGGASTDLGGWFPPQPFTQVFVDQRGTGFTGPDFDCPEISEAIGPILAADSDDGVRLGEQAYAACAARLADDPVLQHTDSVAHAGDVIDVMEALGHREWLVYGVSYGTSIGLELLRLEPAGLVGAILDGVYPPELDTDAGVSFSATRSLDAIDTACAADPTCREFLADGSVRTTLERVMTELDADPIVVPLTASRIGYPEPVDLRLDGRRVAEFAFLVMYQESLIRYLPAVLGGLDDRRESSARWLARTGARLLISSQAANDEGTFFAVQCHDRLPFTDGPGVGVDDFVDAVAPSSLADLCADWQRAPAGVEADDPVFSDVPTLLLSGVFDPITPAAYADEVAARLGSATTVEQGGRGHGIWYGDDCIAAIVQRFAADPNAVPDTSCADSPVPMEWARP